MKKNGNICGGCLHARHSVVLCTLDRRTSGLHAADEAACKAYDGGGLESVLNDMLMCIWQITEAGGCDGSDMPVPPCKRIGDQQPCYEFFEQRLSELGLLDDRHMRGDWS